MSDALSLRDRVSLITGGGTGLGLAVASALSARGARVVLASRSEEHLTEGRRTWKRPGRRR